MGTPKNCIYDPNNRVLGPKYYNSTGIWALKHYCLGPWTLRVMKPEAACEIGLRSQKPLAKYPSLLFRM